MELRSFGLLYSVENFNPLAAHTTSFKYISDCFKNICPHDKTLIVVGEFNDYLLVPENKMSKLIKI